MEEPFPYRYFMAGYICPDCKRRAKMHVSGIFLDEPRCICKVCYGMFARKDCHYPTQKMLRLGLTWYTLDGKKAILLLNRRWIMTLYRMYRKELGLPRRMQKKTINLEDSQKLIKALEDDGYEACFWSKELRYMQKEHLRKKLLSSRKITTKVLR